MDDETVARQGEPDTGLVACGGRVQVQERPQVRAWAVELKGLFDSCGMSPSLFCATRSAPGLIEKTALSRYLRGHRVPSSRWLLDELLALRAAAGTPVTDDVRAHLERLYLAALDAAHPHEYRVLQVRDELTIAAIQLREAQRRADDLQAQIDELTRRLDEHGHRLANLTADNGRLRAAWDEHATRLQAQIDELTAQLAHAQRDHHDAEARCRRLQDLLDGLTATASGASRTDQDPSLTELMDTAARDDLASADPQQQLHGVLTLTHIAQLAPHYRTAVNALHLGFIQTHRRPDTPQPDHLPTHPGKRAALQAALDALRDGLERTLLTALDLTGMNLSDANLSDAKLVNANLRGANLVNANLRGANLSGANLRDADLGDTDLCDAVLCDANLGDADLRGANLGGANLGGADLSDANLGGAILDGADLRGTILSGVILSGVTLSGTDLRDANLRSAIMGGADLHGADLSDANLGNADLRGANLVNANLRGANLRGANLSNADLRGVRGKEETAIRRVTLKTNGTRFGPL